MAHSLKDSDPQVFELAEPGAYTLVLKAVTGYVFRKEIEIKQMKKYKVHLPLDEIFTLVSDQETLLARLRAGSQAVAFVEVYALSRETHVVTDSKEIWAEALFLLQNDGKLTLAYTPDRDEEMHYTRLTYNDLAVLPRFEAFERQGKQQAASCTSDDFSLFPMGRGVILLDNKLCTFELCKGHQQMLFEVMKPLIPEK
ncbi:hypothetical protein SAMN05421823_109266 [Catalinimonas alkaloidigena]|uniref:Uncharacterized protein n=1 Tax=Catalinimonas alkaloidigena TaxID=1075417 RepID=A0A1G9PRA0_9BACT|nr:hypothetical protein [Catalinimonas alkaloidigena]SDM00991.1 hypothetical protein SAMN05421823_109266 [Catalinimonas alkaloidigena]